MNKRLDKSTLLLIVLLLVYAIYAAVYIYQTSFTFGGQRYFALFDDAMISMRYARNLAQGYGLVWNPGERVEGFSNLLWVVYMALLHKLPLSINQVSLPVQVSGAVFMLLILVLVWRITRLLSRDQVFSPLLAVLFTGFYLPLNNWSLQGMEVSLLLLLTCFSLYQALRALQQERFGPLPLLVLGFATWVRFDMAALLAAVTLFLAWADKEHRRQHLIWGTGSLVFFLGSQTVFRWFYYGDLLPNTYYLKMYGYPLLTRLARGFSAFIKFAWNMNWLLFLAPLVFLFFRHEKSVQLLAVSFWVWVVYSLYVGGDAWENHGGANRFIAIGMPAFFILFSLALEQLRLWLPQALKKYKLVTPARLNVLSVAFVVLAMLNFNALLDTTSLLNLALLDTPQFVAGTKRYVEISRVVDNITTENASVAVVTAGNIPYYSQRYTIDLLGKSDKVVARTPPHLGGLLDPNYRPGHDKWDLAYSIGTYQPDVIAQAWEGPGYMDDLLPVIKGKYLRVKVENYPMWVKVDSPNVLWDKVEIIY
jgi:hypothetical protein